MGRESNFSKGFSMTCGCIAALVFVCVLLPVLFFAGVFGLHKVGKDAREEYEQREKSKPTQVEKAPPPGPEKK